MFYWLLKRVLLGPILRLVYRPWAEGVENVPARGAAILAGNHLSVIDSFFMPLVLDRRVTFLAKSDYFSGAGLKGTLKRLFFKGAGQVPVDRSGGQASEAALRTGLKVLARGDLLGIYPEGTRSPDGRLYRGKTGVARLALEARVPVIPIAMIGTEKMQPPGRVIPKIMRPGVRFGKLLDFSRYDGLKDDRFVLRAVTDEIMYALMELSGQEYVDMYAARAKAEIAAARKRHVPPERAAPPRPAPGENPDRLGVAPAGDTGGLDVTDDEDTGEAGGERTGGPDSAPGADRRAS